MRILVKSIPSEALIKIVNHIVLVAEYVTVFRKILSFLTVEKIVFITRRRVIV